MSTFEFQEGTKYLYPEILKDEAVTRLIDLGKVSDAHGFLERTFQSPASVRAGNLIQEWMEDAGLRTWLDQMGNVHGRIEGMNPSEKALLIGSHLDTVIDAGMYDGALGIITAISALKVLNITGRIGRLRRPVEVTIHTNCIKCIASINVGQVAFSDDCIDLLCTDGDMYDNKAQNIELLHPGSIYSA
ncbi:allantoate deiminase 2-like isoform X2 [Olea europaea var. sylvestris]|uniref:allantoate deiminase 2-like isoform X2 n=1 Tax=Olea europaea var. sylvestris TaxID=158386 RepID=UPI000C1D624B|nr:allantoate deiminase 2-like isoform X2 [Olea europaea var. sylvestris]